jgi:hypothetical protein
LAWAHGGAWKCSPRITLALSEREQSSDEFAFAGLRGFSEKLFCAKMMPERGIRRMSRCFACFRLYPSL